MSMKKVFFFVYDFVSGSRKNHQACFYENGIQTAWQKNLSFDDTKEIKAFSESRGFVHLRERDMRMVIQAGGDVIYVPMEYYD